MTMLSRLEVRSLKLKKVENLNWFTGVSGSHTVNGTSRIGSSSFATWSGTAEMIGATAARAAQAPNSGRKAQSTARTIGAPWLQFALWREQVPRSAQVLDLEIGKEKRRCGSFRVLISRPLIDLTIRVEPI